MARIKEYLKILTKSPIILIAIFIILTFGSVSLGKNAEINQYAIVTAIGIDKAENSDNEVEISLLTFVPVAQQSFTEKYKVIKAKGESVSEAIDFAGLSIGRRVGLNHVKILVINEEYFNENASVEMDFLVRDKNLALSTSVVCTDAKASEFLEAVEKLDSEGSIKIDDIIEFNNEYVYSNESTLETFYKGLYGPSKSSLVSFIALSENSDEGVTVSANNGEGQAGNSGSQNSSQSEKTIQNDGSTILCREGREVCHLNSEDMKKINFLRGSFAKGAITIENFSDNVFHNARLTFDIYESYINKRVKFENNIPIVNTDVRVFVKLTEAKENDLEIKENVDYKNMSTEAVNALEKEIKSLIKEGLDILRENQCDIIDVYTLLYNHDPNAMQKFLKSLEDEEDYLNHIIFKISPQIYSS